MKIKPSALCILFALFTIIKSASGEDGNTLSTLKKGIKSYNVLGKGVKKLKTANAVRSIQKASGYAPILKENDPNILMEHILNDVDLVKIAAHRKLVKLYKKATGKEKALFYPLLIKSSTELIKYYSAISAVRYCRKIKITLLEGIYYASQCPETIKAKCYKLKALMLEAFFFSHGVEVNRIIKYKIKNAVSKARSLSGEHDDELNYMETKISCEINYIAKNKNIIKKKLLDIFVGDIKANEKFDCITHLKYFEDKLSTMGQSKAEYEYFLGRAYAKTKQNAIALKHLEKGLHVPVVDTKRRVLNKKIQELLEKINMQLYADL